MKPVAIDHFAKYQMLSRLKANQKGDAAFLVKQADMEANRYKSDLWLLHKGKPLALTHSGDIGSYWWLDDSSLVFTSGRNKKENEKKASTTLYRLNPNQPGEASEWLTLDADLGDLIPLPDGRMILSLTYDPTCPIGEDGTTREPAEEDRADCDVFTELPFWTNWGKLVAGKRQRLYLYDDGKLSPITDEITDTEQLLVSPTKKDIYFVASSYKTRSPIFNKLMKWTIETGVAEDISIAEEFSHSSFTVLEDEKVLVFGTDTKKHGINQNGAFYLFNPSNKKYTLLDDSGQYTAYNSVGTDLSMAGSAEFTPNKDSVYWVSTLNDSSHIMKIDTANGAITQLTSQPGMTAEIALCGENLVFIGMRGLNGCELYQLSKNGEEQQLTAYNVHLAQEYSFSTPVPLAFSNVKGTIIQGWVLPPVHHSPDKKAPVILDIHGGPKTVYGTVLFHEMQYWANLGFAVLYCNPTGGDGRGDDFADIRGQYGEVDYEDLMQFVDVALAQHSWLDPSRLCVTGGSYGGFMTNWIIGHTDRFVAAASQRSISNWFSMGLTTDIGYFFAPDQTAADPWNSPEKLWEQSPLKYADKVVTPTLFLHSDEDYRCWMVEGIQMYTALQMHGVETRMCLFHGESHELSRSGKPHNRVRRLKEITEWFTSHLPQEV